VDLAKVRQTRRAVPFPMPMCLWVLVYTAKAMACLIDNIC
jgi:hypothetical protein